MATIVIAEDEYWQPGIDFAAAMRERGHEAVRLTPDSADLIASRNGLRRWSGVPSRTIASAVTADGIPSALGLAAIDELRPVDWQASESILDWLSENGYESRLDFVRCANLPPEHVQDKLLLTRFLAERGLPVPQTWDDLADIPAGDSGPFMLKARLLGGGQHLHRCADLAEVALRLQDYPDIPYLIQRFHTETPVVIAGVALRGRFVQAMVYASVLNPARPFEMAYGLTVMDDPAALDYAAAVVEAIGLTGPFALDVVSGRDGLPRALDMNVRVWGSWTACQSAGMDVIGSYLHAVGLSGPPSRAVFRPGDTAAILRRPPLSVRSRPQRLRWLAAEGREISRRRRWLGTRWARCAAIDSLAWAVKGPSLDQPAA